MKKNELIKKTICFLFSALLILSMAGCGKTEEAEEEALVIEGTEDGGVVLCMSPSVTLTREWVAEETNVLPAALLFTSTTSVAVTSLKNGNGDSLFTLQPTSDFYAARNDGFTSSVSENTVDLSMLVLLEKSDLRDALSSAIDELKAEGTIDSLYEQWVTAYTAEGRPEDAEEQPVLPYYTDTETGEPASTVRVGISGTLPLVDYVPASGTPGGFTAAFFAALSEKMGVNFSFVSVLPEAKVSALLNDKIDVYFWHFLETPDVCLSTSSYLTLHYSFLKSNLTKDSEEEQEK